MTARVKRRKTIVRHHEPRNDSASTLLLRNLPQRSRVMSFANMLRPRLRTHPRLGVLESLFPKICCRKEQSAMTEVERARFLCAYELINRDGTLGELVQIHRGHFMQHDSVRLLPWHRVFVHLFEEALHTYHPDVCVPYWDWTRPESQRVPEWLSGVLPTVQTLEGPVVVSRSPASGGALAAIADDVPVAMAKTSYAEFASWINGIHGSVHIWVGGAMSNAETSPADPVFWMHHANLDRLWWEWYNSPQGGLENPPLAGEDAVIDPWTYTEPMVRSISALGYTYH